MPLNWESLLFSCIIKIFSCLLYVIQFSLFTNYILTRRHLNLSQGQLFDYKKSTQLKRKENIYSKAFHLLRIIEVKLAIATYHVFSERVVPRS